MIRLKHPKHLPLNDHEKHTSQIATLPKPTLQASIMKDTNIKAILIILVKNMHELLKFKKKEKNMKVQSHITVQDFKIYIFF